MIAFSSKTASIALAVGLLTSASMAEAGPLTFEYDFAVNGLGSGATTQLNQIETGIYNAQITFNTDNVYASFVSTDSTLGIAGDTIDVFQVTSLGGQFTPWAGGPSYSLSLFAPTTLQTGTKDAASNPATFDFLPGSYTGNQTLPLYNLSYTTKSQNNWSGPILVDNLLAIDVSNNANNGSVFLDQYGLGITLSGNSNTLGFLGLQLAAASDDGTAQGQALQIRNIGQGQNIKTVGTKEDLNFVEVPEPSSVALVGAGLMLLGFWARRRNSQQGAIA